MEMKETGPGGPRGCLREVAWSACLWSLILSASCPAQSRHVPERFPAFDPSLAFRVQLTEDSAVGAASLREHAICWHPQRRKFYLIADVVPLASPHHPNTYDTELHLWSSRDLKEWTYHGIAVKKGTPAKTYDGYGVASPAGMSFWNGRLYVPFSARGNSSFGERSIGLAWSGDDPEILPWDKTAEPISNLKGHDDDGALLTLGRQDSLHLYHRIAGPNGYRIVHTASRTPREPASWSRAVPVMPRPETVRAQELTAVYSTDGVIHMLVIEHLHAGGMKIAHLSSSAPSGPFAPANPACRYLMPDAQPKHLAYSGHITPVLRDDRVIAFFWTVFQEGPRYGLLGHPVVSSREKTP